MTQKLDVLLRYAGGWQQKRGRGSILFRMIAKREVVTSAIPKKRVPFRKAWQFPNVGDNERLDVFVLQMAWLRAFDSGLLFCDQALHELGTVLLVGLHSFMQQHLADLSDSSLFLVRNSLNVSS